MSCPRTRSVSVIDVRDQRVIGGAALRGEDTGNGVGIIGPGTEAVDRFGGNYSEMAAC